MPNHVYYVKRRYTDFEKLIDILAAYNLKDVIPPIPEKKI